MTATMLMFIACSKNDNLVGTGWTRGEFNYIEVIEFLSDGKFRKYRENNMEAIINDPIYYGTYTYENGIVRFKGANITYAKIKDDIMTVDGTLIFKKK